MRHGLRFNRRASSAVARLLTTEHLETRRLLASEASLLSDATSIKEISAEVSDARETAPLRLGAPGVAAHAAGGQSRGLGFAPAAVRGGVGSGGGGVPTALAESGGGTGSGYSSGSGSGSGGSGNIRITDAYLRNGLGEEVASPMVGELVAIQLHFETEMLPADADYSIRFEVDGVSLDVSAGNAGAGLAQGVFFRWRSGWYAGSGSHLVRIVVDPSNVVSETDEQDNVASFSFESLPVQLPQRLRWPVEGAPFAANAFTNYVDVDPTAGVRDFAGGPFSYSGHDAWDVGPGSFAAQDEGIDILAAADGVVVDLRDGEFDRHDAWLTPAPGANYVVVDHGQGWTTVYWHLRRDSLQVEIGENVIAGQRLGLMGSSGRSDGTHLHFGLRRHGFAVEPMFDQAGYLHESIPYIGDSKVLMHSGVTNDFPNLHIRERPSDVEIFRQRPQQRVFVWGYFSGLLPGDELAYRWRRPDGSVYVETRTTVAATYAQSWYYWWRSLPAEPDLGEWTVDFLANGETLGQDSFLVTESGAAEIRVQFAGGDIVLNRRYTPVDFGVAEAGAASHSRSFEVVNHGEQPLDLGPIAVPDGFSVVEGLPSVLPPGVSSTFTVELDTGAPGYYAGQIRFDNGDADEGSFQFSVEGLVRSSEKESLRLGLAERRLNEGGRMTGHVRRSGPGVNLAVPLTVSLATSDVSEATVPPFVVIPAGESSAAFVVEAPLDHLEDGDQTVNVQATAEGVAPARNSIDVISVSRPPSAGDPPPIVEQVAVGGGEAQRSKLEKLVIRFDREVEFDDAGSVFSILHRETGASVVHARQVEVAGGKTVVTLYLEEPESLPDGNYQLSIDADLVRAGQAVLDGNADGRPGDDFLFGSREEDRFFRLYGDVDGTASVDLLDFARFRVAFGKSAGQAGYLDALDADNSQTIDLLDFAAFRSSFGNSRSWPS